ncbi:RNA polymerase sigma factor [Altericroceibacterium xinjiangense]|uniref:RNA polymerase sigma factor n=1 Tax=Altericroceibacterium xinjiangense TaxID=762261 RepID=UPI000F7E3989|nr:RNA polymerase sigma factor [Altericroceibacterium xinjiangense]
MATDDDLDEAALVASAKAGSQGAFDHLIGRHAPRLLSLARRLLGSAADAEDAVQNALASAWLGLHRFEDGKPLGPWLTTITVNKCRDALRRQRFARLLSRRKDEPELLIADTAPGQEREIAGRQLLERVEREIARLPASLREPFILVTFDGRSQSEAAQILGMSEKAVETRIYRARARLKEKFAER